MPDHIHVLYGMRPIESLSDLMKAIKGESSEWINKRHLVTDRFSTFCSYRNNEEEEAKSFYRHLVPNGTKNDNGIFAGTSK